jgi:hypothetical protein
VLVARSDLHRAAIRLDVQNIHARTAWVRRAIDTGRAAAPWFAVIAPLAAILFKRKKRIVPSSWIGKAILAWQIARRVKSIWKSTHSTGARERFSRSASVDGSVNGSR